MPTVAAGAAIFETFIFFGCKFESAISRRKRNVTKGSALKDKPPSDDEEQEEEEKQGEETIPKQGKAASFWQIRRQNWRHKMQFPPLH